jgi:hypothetical protein
MKQCPTCNRVYYDKSLKFCLDDGAFLTESVWTREQKLAAFMGLIALITCIIMLLGWQYPQPLPSEQCFLYNNNPQENKIRVRFDCNRRSCDDDETTIIGMYDNGTQIQRKETPPVHGKGFNWIQIIISSGGQTVWVSENKISCKKP